MKSHLEEQFYQNFKMLLKVHAPVVQLEREYKFCPDRRWKFDFAIISLKIGIEIEGGIFSGGRHTRGSGFIKDCEKYNKAAMYGWKVLRYTSKDITSGNAASEVIDFVKLCLTVKV